jgi:hypothetical protein
VHEPKIEVSQFANKINTSPSSFVRWPCGMCQTRVEGRASSFPFEPGYMFIGI